MSQMQLVELDAVIFGGGCAGMWLLDLLHRHHFRVLLLEANALGQGQTVASQGIIHGGLKYTLSNLRDPSAKKIAQMPIIWRACLAGEQKPDLSNTMMRANSCHLWRTDSAKSRLGMTGARAFLRIKPTPLPKADWPKVLSNAGAVFNLPEQVLKPDRFIASLAAQHQPRLLKIDAQEGLTFDQQQDQVTSVCLKHNQNTLTLKPKQIILVAGEGNQQLLKKLKLNPQLMQRRPLHMVMVRGDLPVLNGHCMDFSKTRVTITTDTDQQGQTVWQIGGQISEDGVTMEPKELIIHTKKELRSVLSPSVSLENLSWATYRVNRAEAATESGKRPSGAQIYTAGNVIIGWPSKLALAPRMAGDILEKMNPPQNESNAPMDLSAIQSWPKPAVAQPPWETKQQWITDL